MSYNRAPTSPPCIFAGLRTYFGRVPLMQCFVGGNKTLTLPRSQGAVADSSKGASNGSSYELNTRMWRYGRGQPGRVTVA